MNLNERKKRLTAMLVKKGILRVNYEIDEKLFYLRRLVAKDFVAGIETNPRLLGPAIVLLVCHPKVMENLEELPVDVAETVIALRKGQKEGPDCRYEKYKALYQLCQHSSDGRVKGVNKKIRKNYRIDPSVEKKIQKLLESGKFQNETEIIEKAILSFAS
ncbi:MAG: hypothetical protein OHK0056_29740 [Bacteriovoracaceae bacterium]